MELLESKPNRIMKDKLFNVVMQSPEAKLQVYNALNGTNYTDASALIVTTLENVVYLGMKNDCSFMISNTLSWYEHQSTKNPNMPFRHLLYVTKQLEKIVGKNRIYGSTPICLPNPDFVVFYNGDIKMESTEVIKLSNLYEETSKNHGVKLELIVTVININKGFNEEFKSQCEILKEYSMFVDILKNYKKECDIQTATIKTIDHCIKENILKELLEKERDVVMSCILTEYDEEEVRKIWEEESRAAGHAAGQTRTLVEQIVKKLKKNKSIEMIADELEAEIEKIERLVEEVNKHAPEYDLEAITKALTRE